MAKLLEGRRVVLTGVSRGVGFEIARRFLSEGATIIGVARDPARLTRAAKELTPLAGGRLVTLALDVSGRAAWDAIASAVNERWGALDILINNAAVMITRDDAKGLLDEPEDAIEESLKTNLLGPWHLSRVLIPLLIKGVEPRIIHVSSGAGTMNGMQEDRIASYRLSKWALNGLTMLMARELLGKIAVNALDPGWVKTDMGGPEAPGSPTESAEGALALATASFAKTGKLWKGGAEIEF